MAFKYQQYLIALVHKFTQANLIPGWDSVHSKNPRQFTCLISWYAKYPLAFLQLREGIGIDYIKTTATLPHKPEYVPWHWNVDTLSETGSN